MKQYKYLDIFTVIFVVVLVLSNFIGNAKITQIVNFTFPVGVIMFPLSYLLGDILTEVYGYSKSRRVIWIGFSALLISAMLVQFMLFMPSAKDWPHDDSFKIIFSNSPRVVLCSILAFWAGEFTNSYTLAKMKIFTKGKFLWTRTIGSTIIGEGVDTLIFYPLAFSGVSGFTWSLIFSIMISNYFLKVMWEVVATPVTYKIVAYLKKVENEDFYDYKTDFSPFVIK